MKNIKNEIFIGIYSAKKKNRADKKMREKRIKKLK